MEKNVVTRFAPSPTGFMHIGGMRTALFAWLWARKNNGTFILRIEDTDRERHVDGAIGHIQESLRWLGLEWDYGPDKPGPFGSCIQSERLDSYREFAQKLVDAGHAYADPYSAEEVEAMRKAAQAEKRVFLFRDHRPENPASWDGSRPLRFKVPEVKRYQWHDAVRGDLEAGEEALDDFVLIKSDGWPTYNFAHIIDDHLMGVTHILRADEFISSTPRFLSLYDALGFERPVFATLPPILREDRTKKLGKRDGARDILEYRADGFLPDAMMNFLAFVGWNPGGEQEVFSRDELISAFTLEGIQKAGAIVNEEKLSWFNREHLMRLSPDEFEASALAALKDSLAGRVEWNDDMGKQLMPIIKERVSVWSDIKDLADAGDFDYFFSAPQLDASRIPDKKSTAEEAAKHLAHTAEIFDKVSQFDMESVKSSLWDYATEQGRGAVLWPLRYALSGRDKSPDPFTLASLLGKEETLRRISSAQKLIS